jgi:hypothetical protein
LKPIHECGGQQIDIDPPQPAALEATIAYKRDDYRWGMILAWSI